jgi:pimeloyl-ACP methyl ester carboxylesterase
MDRADLDGIELEYELVGSGEPVVLIHAGCCAAWFAPLLEQADLVDRYRVLSYHRAGYGKSSHPTEPLSISDHATHCRD